MKTTHNDKEDRYTDPTSVFRRKQFERLQRKETFTHIFKVLMLIIAALLAITCAVVYKM